MHIIEYDDNNIKRYWRPIEVATECTKFVKAAYGRQHPPIRVSKIRFWEDSFPQLRPRGKSGRSIRMYSKAELFRILQFALIIESGDYTLQGGIKKLKEQTFYPMTIRVKLTDEDVKVPVYKTKGAACFDFHANADIEIEPGDTVLVPTGLMMEIPEGWELVIRPRSGISLDTNLRIANSPGTIDSDWRGEIQIIFNNIGNETIKINKYDRVAQGKVQRAEQVKFQITEQELSETERGDKGFGHTGMQ